MIWFVVKALIVVTSVSVSYWRLEPGSKDNLIEDMLRFCEYCGCDAPSVTPCSTPSGVHKFIQSIGTSVAETNRISFLFSAILTTTYRHHPFPSCLAHPFDNRPISCDPTISRRCTRRRRYVWDNDEPICIRLPSYLQIFLCTSCLCHMNPCTPPSCCACNATRYE